LSIINSNITSLGPDIEGIYFHGSIDSSITNCIVNSTGSDNVKGVYIDHPSSNISIIDTNITVSSPNAQALALEDLSNSRVINTNIYSKFSVSNYESIGISLIETENCEFVNVSSIMLNLGSLALTLERSSYNNFIDCQVYSSSKPSHERRNDYSS